MPRIVWDAIGERRYETGTDHGVLYPAGSSGEPYTGGVAWNGLTGVTESPSGAEPNAQYADNIKYINIVSPEEFKATIEAFTYPDEFAECDGSAKVAPGVMFGQQNRKSFGFSWRTLIGNDTDGQDHGFKLHLAYGCSASPSEKAHKTINDSPEAINFSWEVNSTPVGTSNPDLRPVGKITIDSTDPEVDSTKLKALMDILYGTESNPPRLPLPDEVLELMAA